MAHYPSISHGNIARFIQLPGRNVLLAGGIIALLTGLVMTSSAQLADSRGKSTRRQEIVGSVRYHGEPLKRGRILFTCQFVEPDMEAIDAEAQIMDGQFHIPKSDGPMPGWFLIRVLNDDAPPSNTPKELVMVYDYDNGPIRVPAGSNLFVRLNMRRLNRFDIEFESIAPTAEELACL